MLTAAGRCCSNSTACRARPPSLIARCRPLRSRAATRPTRRIPREVGAPIPGLITSLSVGTGHPAVTKGRQVAHARGDEDANHALRPCVMWHGRGSQRQGWRNRGEQGFAGADKGNEALPQHSPDLPLSFRPLLRCAVRCALPGSRHLLRELLIPLGYCLCAHFSYFSSPLILFSRFMFIRRTWLLVSDVAELCTRQNSRDTRVPHANRPAPRAPLCVDRSLRVTQRDNRHPRRRRRPLAHLLAAISSWVSC